MECLREIDIGLNKKSGTKVGGKSSYRRVLAEENNSDIR